MRKILSEIFDWFKVLTIALSISIFVTALIVQPYEVSGSSMEPTLNGADINSPDKIADRVMVYKSAYLLGKTPQYNDVVIIDRSIDHVKTIKDAILQSQIVSMILEGNSNDKRFLVKRVIGVAGDTIEYKDGKVIRNGKELKEDYIKEDMDFPFDKVVIPENHVFVMGDNRNVSLDSRRIGPIPVENVVGKAFVRFYPLDKIGKL